MWTYNYPNELYHHGVLGMKWGVRRYQNKDGALTEAGKKHYKPNKSDKSMFGKRGAQRIANHRNNGDSRSTALKKELTRRAAIGLTAATAIAVSAHAIQNGQAEKAVSKLINVGKNAVDSYLNFSVLDSSGNVLARYHDVVTEGAAAVTSLLTR